MCSRSGRSCNRPTNASNPSSNSVSVSDSPACGAPLSASPRYLPPPSSISSRVVPVVVAPSPRVPYAFATSVLIAVAWNPACLRTPIASYITTALTAHAHANDPESYPHCAPTPAASAVTNALCELGNPPLASASAGLHAPPATRAVSGFSACAATTATNAAMRPQLSSADATRGIAARARVRRTDAPSRTILNLNLNRAVELSTAAERDARAMATVAAAVLRGYDDARGEAPSPARAQRAKRGRLDAFARAYARRMESDDDEDDDDERDDDASDDGKENNVDDAAIAREGDGTGESEDEEARDWRAMRAGVMSPRLDRATRRRPKTTSKASRALMMEDYVNFESFEHAESVVRRDGERALSAVAYASERAGARARTLEDSARKTVERVEAKVMAFERNSDEFVARRLHDALESAGLSAEAEEEFRARARRALTRQSRAFEEVIEAADRELVSRVTVSSTAREMMCAEYGEDFVEKYEEANENGIDMTLSIGPRGGKKLAAPIVGLFANTFGAAWKTVNFTLGSPFFIINRVGRTVFRQKRKHTAEQTVEEYREFKITSPTKPPRRGPASVAAAPFSPDAKSDVSSFHSNRRWPLGATTQRAHGAHKRYSIAGSVRSAITRHTIYSNVEYASDEDEEDEFKIDPDGKERRHLIRALARLIQLGCFTAVISLSVGPGDRALKTRQIVTSVYENVRVHVAKGWSAFAVRWAAVSAKLSTTPAEQRHRTPTKVGRSKIPVQVPTYIPLEEEVPVTAPEENVVTASARASGGGGTESLRAFGRG